MVNELAKSCPKWVGTIGFTEPSHQWCARSRGFPTVRAGIVPGNNLFPPRFVGVVHVWNDFFSGDGTVYSPDAAGVRSPTQSVISQWGWGFHAVREGIKPRGAPF